jgi:hypothetical protein
MSDIAKVLRAGYEDLGWLGTNFSTLQATYDGKFVAIKSGRVLASALSMDALLRELQRQRVHATSTIIKYVSKTREIL